MMLGEAGPADLVRSEIRHRFGNIISVTQSLVYQTLRDEVPVEAARNILSDRLAAMGTAIDLLLRTDWKPAPLRATVREALAHHSDCHDRIRCDGPDVRIDSNAVLMLTLALHELGTNAIKHGALSVPEGGVDLVWGTLNAPVGTDLWMHWVEHHGPRVTPPDRRGFGVHLLTDGTARALGGKVALDYKPEGMRWRLQVPLDPVAR
ncbi:HWE histidine kinase domain-containing protein [Sphingomonas sp. TREG-RG-20F-R18-01]|uniref:HWE histidine kinase domain-containing protein n=1 Tax=Sphingomonas sp. TREG-RG-20F-R18-01 TaxID=2914982 RepID=UPI001F5A3E30|nr:HWE histidine kinase domain-containing protein [Sphingomonas sp. TREG-RG-20F-R18-01]